MHPHRLRSGLVTAAALLTLVAAACHDSTGPRNPPGVTKEGVVVAARVAPKTFGISDTVWGTAVLRNPTDAPVTLLLSPPNDTTHSRFVAGGWFSSPDAVSMTEFSKGYVELPGFQYPTLVIPAHDSVTYDFPFVVPPVRGGTSEGAYGFRAAIYPVDTIAKRVTSVVSNIVSATLHL